MIAAFVLIVVTIAYAARLHYLLDGFNELSFKHDRMEVLRVLRGTTGLYLLIGAVTMSLLPLSAWFLVVWSAVGAALILSALGGIEFHHDTADCPECGPAMMWRVESIEDREGYADAVYGDLVVETSTYTMFTVGMDGLSRVEASS